MMRCSWLRLTCGPQADRQVCSRLIELPSMLCARPRFTSGFAEPSYTIVPDTAGFDDARRRFEGPKGHLVGSPLN